MSNSKQIPTALEFLHRDESGVYNEIDIVQAMDDYAKLHIEETKQISYSEGYKEGYNRAIALTKWAISNLIPPHNEQ